MIKSYGDKTILRTLIDDMKRLEETGSKVWLVFLYFFIFTLFGIPDTERRNGGGGGGSSHRPATRIFVQK